MAYRTWADERGTGSIRCWSDTTLGERRLAPVPPAPRGRGRDRREMEGGSATRGADLGRLEPVLTVSDIRGFALRAGDFHLEDRRPGPAGDDSFAFVQNEERDWETEASPEVALPETVISTANTSGCPLE